MIAYYDAYPRSGSHFFNSAFYSAFPGHGLNWTHHSIETLSIHDAVTVVRYPVDSIASYVQHYFTNYSPEVADTCVALNISWLQTTLEMKNSLHIIDFRSLTTDVNHEMSRLGSALNIDYQEISPSQIIDNITPIDSDGAVVYAPSSARNPQLNQIRELLVSNHSEALYEAQSLYESISNA
jgi:hypothetical protein